MNSNIIDKLINEARNSIIDHQLAAAIIKHNKLLSKPFCNIPSYKSYNKVCSSTHAEINAITNYYKHRTKNRSKIDIIVIRINKTNQMCNARPCYNCLELMKKIGVRRVYYSINSNEIICENIKDMISIQVTSYNKFLTKLNNIFNIYEYYENILINTFPPKIKIINLMNFINYNFNHILPNYKIIIDNSKVIIINSKNMIIIEAIII
jgi:tRNA(Arg) A34 adenosine deaminase TadA